MIDERMMGATYCLLGLAQVSPLFAQLLTDLT